MKISKWVDMGQEVDIEIGADDIRAALGEAFQRVSDGSLFSDELPNRNDIIAALNSIGAFLKALTDQQIAALNDAQRKIIGEFLGAQSQRYSSLSVQPETEK